MTEMTIGRNANYLGIYAFKLAYSIAECNYFRWTDERTKHYIIPLIKKK